MIHFCTYFDRNYIHRGLALYQSLVDAAEPFCLSVLAFDDETLEALERLDLPHLRLISQEEFEAGDDALQAVKKTRSLVEYYWTCTPSLPLYVVKRDPSIDVIVYLDADTFFYSSPGAILDELGADDILIVPHDYADEFRDRLENGTYNVGIMAFRRTPGALECLQWWRDRCLEWCFYRHEGGQMGDQKYLEDWPTRFERVVVSTNPGINVAPWNVAKYGVTKDSAGHLRVGSRPLVCYHFHSFVLCTSRIAHITGFQVAISTAKLALIYRPYLDALARAERLLTRNAIDMKLPKSGFPWRYVLGRVARRQPVRHFLPMSRNVD